MTGEETPGPKAEAAPEVEPIAIPTDLGFGTEYEKWLLTGIVEKLHATYRFRSAADYPCNLLLGDSRDVFRSSGVPCTRLLAPEREAPFDLVFSFCEFEQAPDAEAFLRTLDGFGSRYVLIVTQNWRNPGVPLHRLYHLLAGVPWDHGRLSRASDAAVLRTVRRSKLPWKLVERRCFDTPWFVFDVYETGTFLRKLVPEGARVAPPTGMTRSRFERLPFAVSRYLAHHFLLLFDRRHGERPLPVELPAARLVLERSDDLR